MIFRKVSCLLGLLHLTLQVLLHAVQFPRVTAAWGLAMPDANGRVSNGAVNFMGDTLWWTNIAMENPHF